MNKIKKANNENIKVGMTVFKVSHYGYSASDYFQIFKITDINEHAIFGSLLAEGGKFFGDYGIKEQTPEAKHNLTFNNYNVIQELNAQNITKYSYMLDSRCIELLVKYLAINSFNKDLENLIK